ncbi:hypothetical protein bAD24_I11555 [Burkholderia sp. AD24]|nr:hypothetical protein bAD24_I11555 [Burkholderia sp. AD24]
MKSVQHSIIGLPKSGKSTFLAALWHVLSSGEIDSSYEVAQHGDGHAHLNRLAASWMRCEPLGRTTSAGEAKAFVSVREVATGIAVVLNFSDLAGESFEQQIAARQCTRDYQETMSAGGGILLFMSADRKTDGVSIVDLPATSKKAASARKGKQKEIAVQSVDSKTDAAPPVSAAAQVAASASATRKEATKDWSPILMPQQVQLVELLQFAQSKPMGRRHRRVAIVVSAWDVLGNTKLRPKDWVAQEMPLLHQFLNNNRELFEYTVFGVSAQGGDIGDEKVKAELLRKTAAERIKCLSDTVDSHDITSPIAWLTESADA